MRLTKLVFCFCLLAFTGCINLHRQKGTYMEDGISAKERQYRYELEQQQEFLQDFDNPSKKPRFEIDAYHDWW